MTPFLKQLWCGITKGHMHVESIHYPGKFTPCFWCGKEKPLTTGKE